MNILLIDNKTAEIKLGTKVEDGYTCVRYNLKKDAYEFANPDIGATWFSMHRDKRDRYPYLVIKATKIGIDVQPREYLDVKRDANCSVVDIFEGEWRLRTDSDGYEYTILKGQTEESTKEKQGDLFS